MKKRSLLILALLLASVSIFAERALAGDALYLFGIRGEKTTLSLVRDSNDTTESAGYSFLMTDSEVQYLANATNQTGKRIGSWYLVSNTADITVTVTHTPLVCEIDSSVQLDYVLSVQYSQKPPYNLNVQSGEVGQINFSDDSYYQELRSVNISHYGLFVRLTEPFELTNPGGYYGSTVTMEVASNT